MKEIIKVTNLTKDYKNNRGIFDLNFSIYEGEMLGFVGTNGSGKTTTIRSILGFIKPDKGEARIYDKVSWEHSSELLKDIGYVPGEIAFPDLPTGIEFLKNQALFLNLKDFSYANYLIEELQLDPKANLKRMSKGMKQKTALVAALMNDAKIIILDEPTTGLDPLMRQKFIEIIKNEHKKGKTILMSSHMFEELEECCDRVALISEGHIIDIADVKEIKKRNILYYKIEFRNEDDYKDFIKNKKFNITRKQKQYNQLTIKINHNNLNELFKELTKYDIKFIVEVKYTLEKYFKEKLKGDVKNV